MPKSRHPRPAGPTGPYGLPGPSGLSGRDAVADALEALLRATRLVTVTGPGGVGKSALAAEVAHRMAGDRWDTVGFGDLAELDDPAPVPHHLARALRLDVAHGRPQLDDLVRAVGTRPVLLVVDTCERLAGPCAEIFARLVTACPGLHILATSRRSAPHAPDGTFPLRPLPLGAATALFRTRAREYGAEDIGSEAAREICRLLDGLPLAVHIAAAQLARRTAADLLSCLSRPEYVLDLPVPLPGRPERQRTLRGSLGWSLQLCTPLERLLWARCSVFPSAFTASDADVVCGDERLPPESLAVAFGELERQSLILREAAPPGTRAAPDAPFHMPRGARAYGRQWLVDLGEERELLRRCLAWSLSRA
ncbi:transcriptional regulator [Streptomyces chrestomyceticus JCM 4735]|uniref:Transcriptional regulator n=1 Tax=Streptomyces chrestomyceticus JCM 4735 TaxID=1306181 RepID=A0A7U9KVG4_9ACTN|nr:hypothetical protein [Streptomyces chrestomyceticus]GCD36101.1 transcriptional regulator [Streptomyces chrestomyceticus JCM 4735]